MLVFSLLVIFKRFGLLKPEDQLCHSNLKHMIEKLV